MNQVTSVYFTRDGSMADLIEAQIRQTRQTVEAALYRLNIPRLAEGLAGAVRRGIEVRLVLDRGKYEETRATRELLAAHRLPFRLLSGRRDDKAKMHHKFAILDRRTALAGSYNWTTESEEFNFDNLVMLQDQEAVAKFSQEFELLWSVAEKVKEAGE